MSNFRMVLLAAGIAAAAPALQAQPPVRQGPPQGGQPGGMRSGGPGMMGPQAPAGPEMGPPGGPDAASMLLAHTGDLKLTDAQVTKLAAIARRAADRRKSMMSTMDSLRAKNPPPVGAAPEPRQGPPPAALAHMEKMRDAAHVDLRDAITVLTPEQQAQGWEMMARGAHGGPPGAGRRGMQGGPGMQGPQGAGAADGAPPRGPVRPGRPPEAPVDGR